MQWVWALWFSQAVSGEGQWQQRSPKLLLCQEIAVFSGGSGSSTIVDDPEFSDLRSATVVRLSSTMTEPAFLTSLSRREAPPPAHYLGHWQLPTGRRFVAASCRPWRTPALWGSTGVSVGRAAQFVIQPYSHVFVLVNNLDGVSFMTAGFRCCLFVGNSTTAV